MSRQGGRVKGPLTDLVTGNDRLSRDGRIVTIRFTIRVSSIAVVRDTR
jgi:hypothetical protein